MTFLHSTVFLLVRRSALVTMLLLGSGCGDPASQSESSGVNGEEPSASVIEEGAWFKDVAASAGVDFILEADLAATPMLPEIVAGGGAAGDFDGDGRLDLYLVQATGDGGNRLFRNRGRLDFEDVSPGSGAQDGTRFGMGAATGDFDGDGDLDIYVSNNGRDTLLRNDGDFRFVDVTEAAGLGDDGFAASATFFDADGDGDLDLFVTRYVDWSAENELDCRRATGEPDSGASDGYDRPRTDRLYRSEGDGRFSDVSESSGISGSMGTGLGVAFLDVDDDGLLDLFVANDGMPDHLWMNRGGMVFEESAARAGCDRDISGEAKAGMGVAIEDVDDDRDWDVLVCNLGGETDSLHLNQGGRFVDGTTRSGLAAATRRYTRFGLGLVDFDLDGRLDLFAANGRVGVSSRSDDPEDPYAEPDLLLTGSADGRFRLVDEPGVDVESPRTSRGAIFGDFDDDGGVDILVVDRNAPARLLHNQMAGEGCWIVVDVRDPAGGPAIGAEVVIESGERTLRRIVRTDGSYLSARDSRVHVGLGDSSLVPMVVVRWPDGTSRSFADQPCGEILIVPHSAANSSLSP
ncbi:MAG: hypothetical protein GY895_07615 [Phycisphaera sp.]|nr:hypothetical protein [Phycisphaera sp.]